MSRMRVGVQLPEVERVVRWPELVSMARAAEEVGFDSLWIGDHLLYRGDGRPERGPWEAWTTLAGLAAATRRVGLGPLVACAAFHPPGILAKMAANLTEISGGRFVLGMGAGWNRAEFEAFGIPFDRRVARFEESFTIVRRLLEGERVRFEGRFLRVDDAVLLPPPEHPTPLMIGSNGPRVLRIAAPHVEAWNTWFTWTGNTPEGFERLSDAVTETCRSVGRDPRAVARSVCVLVSLDRATAERPLTDEAPPLEGRPEDLARALGAYADAGADELILVPTPNTERSIHALGQVLEILRR